MKFRCTAALLSGLAIAIFAAGCGQNPARSPAQAAFPRPSAEGQKYLLAEEPQGAEDVAKAREAAQDGDDVVVVGRIGGRVDPWTDGVAAFTLVDRSLQACSDIEGDMCRTPWDYCCEPAQSLKKSSMLVKVVDGAGDTVKSDARELLGVKELQTVVVRGRAKRDDAGNLTVLANGIHVHDDRR